MLAFDTSSIVHAWDNYPPARFPPLWEWLEAQFLAGDVGICEVAMSEALDVCPECGEWLKDLGIEPFGIDDPALQMATQIKRQLGIVGDRYGAGVGEKDLLIISSAALSGHTLISEEERQPTLPKNPSKYKIPAVCNMDNVAVKCIRFIDYLNETEAVFR